MKSTRIDLSADRSIDLFGSKAEQVSALELEVAAREAELSELKTRLKTLHDRYMMDIGPLYAELMPLDAEVAELEIKAGLRVADEDFEDPEDDAQVATFAPAGCGPASGPSEDLKRTFRDVLKAVHPDRAGHHDVDERTRYRRHSLMAEANRAYAERDEDRLRLILRAWHLDAEAAIDDDPDAELRRRQRRASILSERLVEIDRELVDLRRSAIARLQVRIDDAKAQGWDLFAEMMRQVKREIQTARARIASLRRSTLKFS